MEEAASMGEEPAYEADDAAFEAPAAEPSMDKAEGAVEAPAEHDVSMQPAMNVAQPNASVSANMEPIVPIVLTAVIAIFILVVVIIFVRKRKR